MASSAAALPTIKGEVPLVITIPDSSSHLLSLMPSPQSPPESPPLFGPARASGTRLLKSGKTPPVKKESSESESDNGKRRKRRKKKRKRQESDDSSWIESTSEIEYQSVATATEDEGSTCESPRQLINKGEIYIVNQFEDAIIDFVKLFVHQLQLDGRGGTIHQARKAVAAFAIRKKMQTDGRQKEKSIEWKKSALDTSAKNKGSPGKGDKSADKKQEKGRDKSDKEKGARDKSVKDKGARGKSVTDKGLKDKGDKEKGVRDKKMKVDAVKKNGSKHDGRKEKK